MHRMKMKVLTLGALGALTLGTVLTADARPAAAQEDPQLNFGHCASFVARTTPPGPVHGQVMRLASVFNPSGLGLECPKPPPGNLNGGIAPATTAPGR